MLLPAWLAMTGAHPKAVQAVMRHSTITLTMDTYGHLFPGQEADTVARLPRMLAAAPEALRATGTDDATAKGQQLGQQLTGETSTQRASGGKSRGGVGGRDDFPEVVSVTRHGGSRQVSASACGGIRTRNSRRFRVPGSAS